MQKHQAATKHLNVALLLPPPAGYEHSLEGFVTEGLQVTRDPKTSLLRINSTTTDTEHEHTAAFEATAVVGSDGDVLYPLPLLSTPSELVAGINNINLQVRVHDNKELLPGICNRQQHTSAGIMCPKASGFSEHTTHAVAAMVAVS